MKRRRRGGGGEGFEEKKVAGEMEVAAEAKHDGGGVEVREMEGKRWEQRKEVKVG